MNNIKLNDNQIKELTKKYQYGHKYLVCNKNGTMNTFWSCPSKDIKLGHWRTSGMHSEIKETYDFISWEDKEPFYFGDLFEVVYKGEINDTSI